MKKKLLLATAFLAALCLASTQIAHAEDLSAFSSSQEIVHDYDLFTEEQMAEWNVEVPKPIEADSKDYTRAPVGSWSTRAGVIVVSDATSSGVITHGHAGIMGTGNRHSYIIESNPADGVQAKHKTWPKANQVWQLEVRNTTLAQDRAAAQWAANQIGKPYNFNFYDVWRRDRFYCSQLVWAAYRDTVGSKADISLNDYGAAIHPFELRDHSNTAVIYRKK
ncbi:TPA: hypothetical protein U1344_000331 [Streptococcus suis]|nr:hypothetical protein [Streptococcus suis]HEM4989975.1 hypothetical protein [Streptococcus suis]HEM5206248.1 hypothetical protein [Streptococcus suis]HEM5226260.1 hypothetical protein [Streptococcus suis]HEM5228444.1 hypothetical protein [Streptococcus suis]